MKLLFITLLAFSGTACAARESFHLVPQDKRLERLESERAKLARQQNDPVGRTKTQIKIADILLTLVSDAARASDLNVLHARLDEYLSAIRDARQTMMKTGRNAHQKPGGFKDLEIALRQQVRQLEDIGAGLTFDQRDPVSKARDEALGIRDEMLKALFGSDNAPSRG